MLLTTNQPPSWRREWDSNPRYGFPYTHFPSVRLRIFLDSRYINPRETFNNYFIYFGFKLQINNADDTPTTGYIGAIGGGRGMYIVVIKNNEKQM